MSTQVRPAAAPVPVVSAAGGRWRRGVIAWPAPAGLGFAAAWIAGLSIFSASTTVHATGAQVVAGYAGHQAVATAQFALTEGAAAVCLALVALALGRAGLAAGAGRPARLVAVGGAGAAVISLAQCAIGVYLAGWAVPSGDAAAAGTLNEAITRMDGVKMLVLAGMGLAGAALARRGALPRWLAYAGIALALAIIVSGVGYLLLAGGLAAAAWVSLPLLLVWVTGAAIAVGRSGRPGRVGRPGTAGR